MKIVTLKFEWNLFQFSNFILVKLEYWNEFQSNLIKGCNLHFSRYFIYKYIQNIWN